MDVDDDQKLSPDEVINAVQDVYSPNATTLLGTDFVDLAGTGAVADAFAAMNNQPHLGAGGF
jgi:hypothetical protein